jgi:hypothetical protein
MLLRMKKDSVHKIGLRYFFAAIVALCVGQQVDSAQPIPIYTRKLGLPPIRMSYSDLSSTLETVSALLNKANTGITEDWRSEKLQLEGEGPGLTVSNSFGREILERGPTVAYRASYSFLVGVRQPAPISSVQIDLRDFSRELSVEGADLDQVEAIFAVAAARLSNHATVFGGFWAKTIGSLFLVFAGIGLIVHALPPNSLRGWTRWLSLTAGILIAGGNFVLPWSELLPGTAVYAGDASIIVRRQAEISLAGVLLTVLLSATGYYISWRLAKRRPASPPAT